MPAAGYHYLAACVDVNSDGRYQQMEPAAFYGAPTKDEVVSFQNVTLDPVVLKGPLAAEFEDINLEEK